MDELHRRARSTNHTKARIAVATALMFLGVSSAVNANCQAMGCFNVMVTELYMNAWAGGFYIQTSGDETLANCTPDSGVFLHVPESTAHLKEVYATLLAAQLADRPVSIRVNEGSSPCTVSYIRLTS
jgi:hypothetical protein